MNVTIHRRTFLAALGGAAAASAWPRRPNAQPAVPLVAVLSPQVPQLALRNMEGLREGLRSFGYIEGRNVAIETRFANGVLERLPALASELVALKPHAIVAGSQPAILAARKATSTIPIVMSAIAQDPITVGVAASLSRPGGNVTGIWSANDGELVGKRFELLKDAVRGITRLGVIYNPDDEGDLSGNLAALPDLARAVGIEVVTIQMRNPDDIESAIAHAIRERVQGLYVSQSPLFFVNRDKIATVLLRERLPSISGYGDFAKAGGLLAYAPNLADIYQRSAFFVDNILKGTNAADRPIERPVKYELIVNLKTAKALGMIIPEGFLVRADEVVE